MLGRLAMALPVNTKMLHSFKYGQIRAGLFQAYEKRAT